MKNNSYKLLFLIFTGLFIIISGSVSAYSESWVDGTPYIYEEAQELYRMMGQNNQAAFAPALADAVPAVAYEIGDKREFYALNIAKSTQYTLEASLRAVSDKAYVFVENGRPAAKNRINSLLDSFDGIYDNVTSQFGPPPDIVDRDPRIYLLIMDILDGANPNGQRMIGYFSPIDQFRNFQLARWSNRRSNEADMLYIDYAALTSLPDGGKSVIAHEFTHLIEWGRDPEEAVWVNEGIAVYTESMLGYNVDGRIDIFEKNPNVSLINWSGTLEDYRAAYLFFAYVAERFGKDSIPSIMKNRSQNMEGIEKALAMLGKSVSFNKIFSDWVIANYLDNPKIEDGIYGYATLDINLKPSVVEDMYPIDHKTSSVKPWAARYIEFRKNNEDSLSLTIYNNGANDIVAQIIEPDIDITVSSVKSNKQQSGTTIIPQDNSRTIMVVSSQPSNPIRNNRDSTYIYSAEPQAIITPVEAISDKKIITWGKIKRN